MTASYLLNKNCYDLGKYEYSGIYCYVEHKLFFSQFFYSAFLVCSAVDHINSNYHAPLSQYFLRNTTFKDNLQLLVLYTSQMKTWCINRHVLLF